MGLLRLLLAISVIVFHAAHESYMITGPQAVQVFFVISGFYMAMILTEKYGDSTQGIKKFFLNRALRLYPTYYLALVGTMAWQIFCIWSMHHQQHPSPFFALREAAGRFHDNLTWLPNYTLVGLDISMLLDRSVAQGLVLHADGPQLPGTQPLEDYIIIGQMWSVAAEIWFYVLAPRLVFGPTSRVMWIALASLGLQLALRQFSGRFAYFFWPADLYLFALGILGFKAYARLRPKLETMRNPVADRLFVFGALFWLTLMPAIGLRLWEWLIPSSAAVLVPCLFFLTKENGWDRFVGNLSYPIYCVHMIVWEMARTFIGRFHLSYGWFTVLTISCSILAGIIVYYLVDHVVERVRVSIAGSKTLFKRQKT